MVLSPNGSIDVKALPHFEWFRLRHFIEQVHYLKQFGLPLECNKVDFSKFYRHFVLVAAAVPSHMQIWTDEEDGTHLVKDDRMNFGDAAAAPRDEPPPRPRRQRRHHLRTRQMG